MLTCSTRRRHTHTHTPIHAEVWSEIGLVLYISKHSSRLLLVTFTLEVVPLRTDTPISAPPLKAGRLLESLFRHICRPSPAIPPWLSEYCQNDTLSPLSSIFGTERRPRRPNLANKEARNDNHVVLGHELWVLSLLCPESLSWWSQFVSSLQVGAPSHISRHLLRSSKYKLNFTVWSVWPYSIKFKCHAA